MRHLDLFSGILGFSEAAKRAWGGDYELLAAVEIDKSCHNLIRRHRPGAAIVDDVRKIRGDEYETVDLVSFGWPCQDLSVAGKREGLAGKRSGLLFEALRIIEAVKPKWFVAENVPGLLSSQGGRDMGTAIRAMEDLGYCVSWRILDAQHFGVPQRRRRIFFVGSLGSTDSIKVLFEPESVSWNPSPSREKRQGFASDSKRCAGTSGRRLEVFGGGNTSGPIDVAACLSTRSTQRQDFETESLIDNKAYFNAEGRSKFISTQTATCLRAEQAKQADTDLIVYKANKAISFHSRQDPISENECSLPLEAKGGQAICFQQNTRDEVRKIGGEGKIAGALSSQPGAKQQNYIASSMSVRRLTPKECERLQGFEDGWTLWGIDENGKRVNMADGPRYRMLGNAVAVPVVEWIMRRIKQVDDERF